MSCVYNDQITRDDALQRDDTLCSVFFEQPYLIHLQSHASGQVIDGLLVCPLFECVSDIQQKMHGVCRRKVSCQQ